jgi:hypothetical protein
MAKLHTWGCIEGNHEDNWNWEANFINLNVNALRAGKRLKGKGKKEPHNSS